MFEANLNSKLLLPDSVIEEIARRVAEIHDAGKTEHGYLTVNEAADYLRCSRQRIYDLTSARQLPVLKDGKRSLYLRSDLDSLLKARCN